MARKKRDGMFNFVNKDDPNYRPNYGSTYTKRQMDVLAGIIPLEEVRINDLAILVHKAEQMGDIETYEQAKELYDRKLDPGTYFPTYTIEEAKNILQRLTPWKIDWGDSNG